MALARPRRASKHLTCRLWILSSTYEKGKYCYDQQVQGIWGQYWYNFPFVFHICFPYLSLILISHTCFPYLFPTGFLGPHEFLLISHTCLPYLSPILVSHTCLPLWVPWGAWGKAGNKYKEKFRNNILYRKPKNNFDFLHLFGINVGINYYLFYIY